LPGNWKTNVEEDGISATSEKDAAGIYKTFGLSLSGKVSGSDFRKSKEDFTHYFNAIESMDKSLKLVRGNLLFRSKSNVEFTYFILYGTESNILTFYALTSLKSRVLLISYKVFQVSHDLEIWENDFTAVLNSLI